ncbi:MAG: penicillin-binding transpeptidase domain-containing protein [Bacillota bacterium]
MLNKLDTNIKKRIFVLLIILTIIFIFFIVKFFLIQILNNEKYEEMALGQRLRELKVEAKRGNIYDQNGNKLAISGTAETLVAIPSDIKDAKKLAEKVAKILDLEYDLVYNRLTSDASAKYVKRKISENEAQKIKDLNADGLIFKDESKRFYPKEDLASHIIGFSGIDNQGLEGIELSFDNYLQGVPGKIAVERDAAGRTLPNSVKKYIPSTKGYNIYLTIDEVIQYIVERELDEAKQKLNISGGTAIVMDPENGSILAMANTPDYNLNNFTEYPQKNWRNRAISDSYEPGSTFKIITTAAALEEGVVNEEDSFYCSGNIKVSGETISCWKHGGHGQQSFSDVVKNSCNPGFVQVGMKLGKEKFYNYIKSFGFGEKTNINIPGESNGLVYDYNQIGPVELATMSYGHGISVTPLQLITAASAIANDGMLLEPKLVDKITDENNNTVEEIQKTQVRQVITEKSAERTRDLLERVVKEGTGAAAGIDGFQIGGKTGTAKHYKENIYDSSFIGMVPTDDPEFVVLVVLYDVSGQSYYGSQTAAPIFRNILLDLLRYKDKSPKIEEEKVTENKKEIEIPNLIDKEVNVAEKELRKKGFDVKLVGMGEKVLKQIPLSGAKEKENSTVILFTDENAVNNIGYYVSVPDLEGKDVDTAEKILKSLGLKLVVNGNKNNEIIKQNIAPGERIKAESTIIVDTKS